MSDVSLGTEALSALLPMHLVLDAQGQILQAGPTLRKLFADTPPEGQDFFALFQPRRPYGIETVADLLQHQGAKLHLRLRDERRTPLKGVVVAAGQAGGVVLNLSFGITIIEAVATYDMTAADFAPTDLTVEMLYLVEAKTAAMQAWQRLNTRLQGAKIAAEEQAYTDTLTGLKNRRAMDHVLARFIDAGEPFGLMHLDLDFFKQVNDTLGHAAGDHVLQEVARVLVEETRADDLVARVGGDEFVLLFRGMTDIDKLNDIAVRIIAKLEQPIRYGEELCRISGSIGTVLSDRYEAPAPAQLLDDADMALYASKRSGRARHTVYSDALRDGSAMPKAEAPTPARH